MMNKSLIQVICGPGRGKTTGAIGRGIVDLGSGKSVIMVQFLKGSMDADKMEVIKRLEPEFKVFRFEKSCTRFEELSPQEKEDARASIRNGINFARKVLVTGECDILILDEILGILDEGIITSEELIMLIDQARQGDAQLILTGTKCPVELAEKADEITVIQTEDRV